MSEQDDDCSEPTAAAVAQRLIPHSPPELEASMVSVNPSRFVFVLDGKGQNFSHPIPRAVQLLSFLFHYYPTNKALYFCFLFCFCLFHFILKELKLKDEECERLSKVRDQLGQELEELTASLFEVCSGFSIDLSPRVTSTRALRGWTL